MHRSVGAASRGSPIGAEREVTSVLRIFPGTPELVPLHGLYLGERFGPLAAREQPFVYANFIVSLDGRISLPDVRSANRKAPRALANARDWRLFQELAAVADGLITSGRHVRHHGVSARSFPLSGALAYEDLRRWREERGLPVQPAVIIVSASLELPPLAPLVDSGRSVYVATGRRATAGSVARLEAEGVRVLLAGDGARLEGSRLRAALAAEGLFRVAMIAGGEVLNALIVDDVLDRLYLTLACRLLGGHAFDTLLTGPELEPARRFELKALHYDAAADGSGVEQLFAMLDRGGPAAHAA